MTIEPADLSAWLRTRWLGHSRTFHESLPSTQDEARRLAEAGADHGHLVWAAKQTAGRGRLAREWHSPAMSGLWFSVVLRPGRPAADVAALPLAVGAAVATALNGEPAAGVRLKWPNDVLLAGRKVAGILVEGHARGQCIEHVVVGIGINLRRPPQGFPPGIADTAGALADGGAEPRPLAVLAAVLGELEQAYEELLDAGPAGARRRWLAVADTIGRDVVAHAGGDRVEGRAVNLDEEGNLVLQTPQGRRTIAYGEVEHLRAAGPG